MKLSRKTRKLTSSLLVSAALLSSVPFGTAALHAEEAPASETTESRPNIVNIILDDWGYMDSSLYRNYTLGQTEGSFYETPNFDALAEEGVMFTSAYSGSNLCSSSRGMFLTGRYGPRNGLTRLCNLSSVAPTELETLTNWDGTPYLQEAASGYLPREEVTIAELLSDNGYNTAHIGKWHLGDPDKGYGPTDQGFDINIGGYVRGQPRSYFSPYQNPYLEDGPDGENLNDRLAAEADAYITEQAESGELFFLNFAQYAVHTPLSGKQEYNDYFSKKDQDAGRGNPVYASVIKSADDAIGTVIQSLKDNGIYDNTLIIVTSDNGGLDYWNVTDNTPLKKGKCFNYEGGIRVPTLMIWKDHIVADTVEDTPVHFVDMFPTIADAAGAELPENVEIDGDSLLPMLNKKEDLSKRSIFWFNPHINDELQIYDSQWPGKGAVNADWAPASVAVRKGDYKMIWNLTPPDTRKTGWDSTEFELYNIRKDMSETTNLADTETDKAEELKAELKGFLEETRAIVPKAKNPSSNIPVLEGVDLSTADITASSTKDGTSPANVADTSASVWTAAEAGKADLDIDLKSESKVSGLTMTPDAAGNGIVTEYEIYTGTDGKNYTLAAKGGLATDTTEKAIHFDAVNARYIKFRAINAKGGVPSIKTLSVQADNEVTEVEQIVLKTPVGMPATLPETIKVTYADGQVLDYPVTWNSASINWGRAGNYTVDGTIAGLGTEVSMQVTVEEAVKEADAEKTVLASVMEPGTKLADFQALKQDGAFSVQFNLQMQEAPAKSSTLLTTTNGGLRLNVDDDGKLSLHMENAALPNDLSYPYEIMRSENSVCTGETLQVRLAVSKDYRRVSLFVNNKLEASGVLTDLDSIEDADLLAGTLAAHMNSAVSFNAFLLQAETDEPGTPGDFSGDGKVDISDLGIATDSLGKAAGKADVNGNGVVDQDDISYIMDSILTTWSPVQ